MTSKEALNSLEKLLKDLPYAVNLKEYHNVIFKDLDRLEKLEKVVEILKEYLFIIFEGDTIINDEEFIITIGDKERVFNHSDDVFRIVVKKEENDLLKEVLENVEN